MRAAARQACLGLVAVVVSLPLLWALQRRFGLAQGSEGVLLLGAAQLPVLLLLAWAPLGSMLGAALEYRLAARR